MWAILLVLSAQGSRPVLDQPVAGGQLELIRGLQERQASTLFHYYQKFNAPIIGPDNVVPSSMVEANLGFCRSSVSIGLLAGKQVRILRSEAFAKQSAPGSDAAGATVWDTWWVDIEGKILRHFRKKIDRDGTVEADCAYRSDRIDVTTRRPNRPDDRKTFVPVMPMQQLHDRFLPMDGEKPLDLKEFVEFDPLRGVFETFTLRRGGRFVSSNDNDTRGPLGLYFDLKGPGIDERIYIRDNNTIARIDLPRERHLRPGGPTTGG
ncbi:MAG: hypothetical protein ACOYON_06850 [Fimbriimonas sp.]